MARNFRNCTKSFTPTGEEGTKIMDIIQEITQKLKKEEAKFMEKLKKRQSGDAASNVDLSPLLEEIAKLQAKIECLDENSDKYPQFTTTAKIFKCLLLRDVTIKRLKSTIKRLEAQNTTLNERLVLLEKALGCSGSEKVKIFSAKNLSADDARIILSSFSHCWNEDYARYILPNVADLPFVEQIDHFIDLDDDSQRARLDELNAKCPIDKEIINFLATLRKLGTNYAHGPEFQMCDLSLVDQAYALLFPKKTLNQEIFKKMREICPFIGLKTLHK